MKRIAVFTSGGDAPGMNACIRAVVRAGAHFGVEVYGIYNGYQGLIDNEVQLLESGNVANIIQYGGTILKTARCAAFFKKKGRDAAFETIKKHQIDGLVAIGGNGTYTGAMHLFKENGLPIVGCPGTIDNDLFGTDYTIGFHTSINTAVDAIDKIRDTADSHHRVFFVEVMGRHSGHIALHAGIAGGAEAIFIPEREGELDAIIEKFAHRQRRKQFSIFVVAEGETEGNSNQIAKKFKKRYPDADCRVTILGHIQRGGSPTSADRIMASRMGAHAVKGLCEGYTNHAVGVINNEIVFTPFEQAVNGKKDINNHLWEMNLFLGQ